jgi:hypothetical protein
MEETYIEGMKAEKAELKGRITKLFAFIEGDKFKSLEPDERRLLMMQYCGMETYLTSLAARLLREDAKRYESDIKSLKAQADEMRKEGKTDEEIMALCVQKVKEIPPIGDGQFDSLDSLVSMACAMLDKKP